ncbi:M48 family metallopeptidase [Candidatus Uhrbacteria bacterium]|nr:M48 family metallopeptidase [Candidatus Uhrbacteria bacterium]MBI4434750.1 M48 family metallopeptidase [Candidatus Uhrbacteria bacterium]
MYNQITANKRRTFLLIGAFVLIVLLIGYAYDAMLGGGAGAGGVVFAIIVSCGMALLSYYGGDRIALWTSGARAIEKRDQPYLYRIVENLAITAGLQTPKVYIIQDPAVNAFATGRDPAHASVAVTTGAIERLANEELEGVIAHELSHIKNYDIRVMTIVIVLVGTIALLSDWLLRMRWYGGSHREDRGSNQATIVLLVVGLALAIVAPLIAELIKLAVSRRREYLADASGALLTRYPEGLARALEKIAAANQPMLRANTATAHLFLSNPFGSRRRRFMHLFSTHPPVEDRVRILRSMAI